MIDLSKIDFDKIIDDEIKRDEEYSKVVSSIEFKKWLVDYINVNGTLNDDVDMYDFLSDEDKKYMKYISYFISNLYYRDESPCDIYGYFKFSDSSISEYNYSFEEHFGQGSFRIIKKCTDIIDIYEYELI